MKWNCDGFVCNKYFFDNFNYAQENRHANYNGALRRFLSKQNNFGTLFDHNSSQLAIMTSVRKKIHMNSDFVIIEGEKFQKSLL